MQTMTTPAFRSWPIYLHEVRCELLRLLREPMFIVPTLLFPALFYVLFGVLLNRGSAAAAQYLLATYGVFGVMGASLFGFGVTLATDREQGYFRLKRALPMPASAFVVAKMAVAMLFAVALWCLLSLLAAWLAGVHLGPARWWLLLVVNVLGTLPFCAVGLFLGAVVSARAAPAVINLLFLPMAFLSGLWVPLSMLPALFDKLAPVWPAWHLAQIALATLGHAPARPLWLHLLVLAVVTVVFSNFARRRLQAAE